MSTTLSIDADHALNWSMLHTGDLLRVLAKDDQSATLELITTTKSDPSRRERGSAGAWARSAKGIARLAEGGSHDDARMAYYREKYGTP